MKQLISYIPIIILLSFCSCTAIWYIGEDRTSAICTNCKKLSSLENQVEYLEISTENCKKIDTSIFKISSLSEFVVSCDAIQFPNVASNNTLKVISIIDPILNEMPELVYHSPELIRLIVFLKTGKFDNTQMGNLKKLETLKLGIVELSKSPDFIANLTQLKELRIFSKNDKMIKLPSLSKLEKLEVLEAPIDLSENLNTILELKELKILYARAFSTLKEDAEKLKKLPLLKEICLPSLSLEERVILTEALPGINLICRNNLIFPYRWERKYYQKPH